MKIRLLIFFVFVLIFQCELKAQKTNTEHRIESKVLLAVIDDNILEKPIELKTVKKFDFKTFKVFNSYKNEYLFADSIKVMYQSPLDVHDYLFITKGENYLHELKLNLDKIQNGDIVYISAQITIVNIKYEIYFSYLIKGIDKKLFLMASENSTLEVIK